MQLPSTTPNPLESTPRRGVVAVIVRDDRLLVIRRSAVVVAPRAFCFPGGVIEGNESEAVALERELREELGVSARPLRAVWRSVTPWNVDLAWWSTALDADQVIEPNPDEVESVHWLTTGEMLALDELLPSNRAFLAALAERAFQLP